MVIINSDLINLGEQMNIDDGCTIGYMPIRKIASYQLKIGGNALIRTGSIIYLGSEIGRDFETGHNVIIREECTIGHNVKIWNNSVIDYDVYIGNDVKIHSLCYISQESRIEDNCFIAPGVMIANEKYPTGKFDADRIEGVTVRKGAKIGINVTLLPGIEIGEFAIIGAGSTVTKDVDENSIYYGNPARKTARSN